MRTVVVGMALLVGCSTERAAKPPPAPTLALPTVEASDAVVQLPVTKPPAIVIVGRDGGLSLAAAPSTWRELATFVPASSEPVTRDALDAKMRAIEESFVPPRGLGSGTSIDAAVDEDGDEDTDRPEEQRDYDIDWAGGFGVHEPQRPTTGSVTSDGTRVPPPQRVASITGEVVRELPSRVPALILADPQSSAPALVEAVTASRGALGVRHGAEVTALRLSFVTERAATSGDPLWVELRADSTDHLELEVVPDHVTTVTLSGLAAALDKRRMERDVDPWNPVDVLVGPGLTAQQLVELLVVLEKAGTHTVGLGPLPSASDMKVRGTPLRTFGARVMVIGELEKGLVQPRIDEDLALVRCVPTDARGTVSVAFFVAPTGKIVGMNAESKTHPESANCMRDHLATYEFPRSAHGGGTQVNVTFVFGGRWEPRARGLPRHPPPPRQRFDPID